MKIFNHKFVEPIDAYTENINGFRYYVLPNGEKYKSVTTILSEKLDKSALIEWKNRVGPEEANRISTAAKIRGTSVHNLAEKYVLNQEYGPDTSIEDLNTFLPIKNELDNNVDNILGVELALYSKALKAAGRTDLIAEYDGTPSVIDFKTSKRLKKEEWIESYFLQSTTYAAMFYSMYKIFIPQIVVMITVDGEDLPQVFVKDMKQYMSKVITIFTS